MNRPNALRQAAFALIALGVAGAVVGAFFYMKPKARKRSRKTKTAFVEVEKAVFDDGPRIIEASGTVRAANTSVLSAEVKGAITFVANELTDGGRVKKGQILVRIDSRDYRAAVQVERGRLAQATLNLQLEEGRSRVAEREWKLVGKEGAASELALRLPQLQNARAQVHAAEAALKRAQLNVARTTIRAPFDAIVQQKSASLGQVAAPGAKLATLDDTSAIWVEVSLPLARATALHFGDGASTAQVHYHGQERIFTAKALRLLGQIDAQTRSATALFVVDAPFAEDGLPLLPGAFVEVKIAATPLHAVRVPRRALRDGDTLFVVGSDDKLQKRHVTITWTARDWLWLSDGVQKEERVLVTPLAFPTDGMVVQIAKADKR